MEIKSIYDESFKKYGKVIEHNFEDLINKAKSFTSNNCEYSPESDVLSNSIDKEFLIEYFGYMPIQIGICYGKNKMLNCLEYHMSSEVNIASYDCILLLGTIFDIKDGKYNVENVEAFMLKENQAVELFSTTLHYAPINVNEYFSTIIVLPKGTNYDLEKPSNDKLLYQTNKWLLALDGTNEAKNGAYIGLVGENICL